MLGGTTQSSAASPVQLAQKARPSWLRVLRGNAYAPDWTLPTGCCRRQLAIELLQQAWQVVQDASVYVPSQIL